MTPALAHCFLNLLSALSRDSLSLILISAIYFPPIRQLAGVTVNTLHEMYYTVSPAFCQEKKKIKNDLFAFCQIHGILFLNFSKLRRLFFRYTAILRDDRIKNRVSNLPRFLVRSFSCPTICTAVRLSGCSK